MALSFGIHDFIEGGVITAVIILNIVVGYDLNLKLTRAFITNSSHIALFRITVLRGKFFPSRTFPSLFARFSVMAVSTLLKQSPWSLEISFWYQPVI